MKTYFTADKYDTPADTPHHFLDKLALNSRFYYLARFFEIMSRARLQVACGRDGETLIVKASYRLFKVIEGCGGRFHLRGLNTLENFESPVVFVGNHMSGIEANILPCFIYPHMPMTFVVKASLIKYPLFGPILRKYTPITVERKNPRQDFQRVMEKGVQKLKQGISVIIFPQSTRTIKFEPEQFNSLGVKLARKANVPVVPIALKTDFWRNGSWFKDLGGIDRMKPLRFSFGEPITVRGNGRQAQQTVVDFIQRHLSQWMPASSL